MTKSNPQLSTISRPRCSNGQQPYRNYRSDFACTSATLACTPKKLLKATVRFLSFRDTPHIHLLHFYFLYLFIRKFTSRRTIHTTAPQRRSNDTSSFSRTTSIIRFNLSRLNFQPSSLMLQSHMLTLYTSSAYLSLYIV